MAKQKATGRYAVKDSGLLKLARERWKFADDADGKQSQREIDDLGFYAGDPQQQWGAAALSMRGAQAATQAGVPATPERPTLVINKVLEPVRQVQNEIRAADIGIELVPADDFGDLGVTPDDTEVTLREGLIRLIQRESEAEAARNWAGDRATIAGRGYYMVLTRYLPGKTRNQEVYVHRIYNQAGVKLDPSHEQPDGSDADWGFVGTWMPWDRFADVYPKLADGKDNPFSESGPEDFTSMTEKYPDWYQAAAPADKTKGTDARQDAVRIVDYWYTERTSRELVMFEDGTDLWKDEVPAGDARHVFDTRTVVDKQIKFCKIAGGVMVLEETEWAGPDLPIIKVLGEELQPYDEQRRAIGMVRPARGAQQGFNYMISKLVETVGLTPIPPIIYDPDAIDGYEEWWKQAATRPFFGLPHRTFDDQQRQLAPPHRPNVDPNLQPMSISLGMFDQLIKSTTAVPDPTLGNVDPALKSGKAIREVVSNAKASTSNFLDNRVIATRREGHIINGLLYPIYGRPGRTVEIMTGESERKKFQIADPSAQGGGAVSPEMMQRAIQVGKLTKDANFNIIAKVTKNEESRRQQEASALGEIIAADPAQMSVFGDLFFLNSDIPGHKTLAERAKVMLAPPIQAMLAQKEGKGETPQMLQQKIAQMTEQMQHAELAIKELSEEARGKKLDVEGKVEVERLQTERDVLLEKMRAETELEKARMDNATKLRVAEIAAETKGIIDAHRMEHEGMALAHETQHAESEAEKDRAQDRSLAVASMAHEAASADGQRDHEVATTPTEPSA